MEARLGTQTGFVQYAFEKRTPVRPSASRFGVRANGSPSTLRMPFECWSDISKRTFLGLPVWLGGNPCPIRLGKIPREAPDSLAPAAATAPTTPLERNVRRLSLAIVPRPTQTGC